MHTENKSSSHFCIKMGRKMKLQLKIIRITFTNIIIKQTCTWNP